MKRAKQKYLSILYSCGDFIANVALTLAFVASTQLAQAPPGAPTQGCCLPHQPGALSKENLAKPRPKAAFRPHRKLDVQSAA